MRIIIDLQGIQTVDALNRGITRHIIALLKIILIEYKQHEIILVFHANNNTYCINDIKFQLKGLLPAENIKIWHSIDSTQYLSYNTKEKRRIAELIREAFLTHLNPDIVIDTYLFHGLYQNSANSVGAFNTDLPTAAFVYDLMPIISRHLHLGNDKVESWYLDKIANLKSTNLLFGFSNTGVEEIKLELTTSNHFQHHILTPGPSTDFHPIHLSAEEQQQAFNHFNINQSFLLYTGDLGNPNSLRNLFMAYSHLPTSLRISHQIVIAYIDADQKIIGHIQDEAAKYLRANELLFIKIHNTQELNLIYNLSTAFIFCSPYEGFCLPLLEAMACHKAIIAGNTPYTKEIIKNEKALFDVRDTEDIFAKLMAILTDPTFKQSLINENVQTIQDYSLQKCAKKFIEKLENWHPTRKNQNACPQKKRTKLAYIFPNTLKENILKYHEKLLAKLKINYDIEIAIDNPNICEPWLKNNYRLITHEYFETKHLSDYDRVIYHLIDDETAYHTFSCIKKQPGIIILHNTYLTSMPEYLYENHGYHAVYNLNSSTQTSHQFSNNAHILNHAVDYINHDTPLNDLIAKIELSYEKNKGSLLIHKLIHHIIHNPGESIQSSELIYLSQAIERSIPPVFRTKQIFIDISALYLHDLKTGIQRVVRSILRHLIISPPTGFRIEPVYACNEIEYRYARQFSFDFLNQKKPSIQDTPIEYHTGDIFIGLDFVCDTVISKQYFYQALRNQGISVHFVVYDLLPIKMPHNFPRQTNINHEKWLSVICQNDSVLCISKAVADEVQDWLAIHSHFYPHKPHVGWFHLGADIENSAPSTGLAKNASTVLAKLKSHTTFLMVSTIEPRKGYAQALAAFELLWQKDRDILLVIVGKNGWMMDEFAAKLRNHAELNKRLFWLEGISDEYMEKIYTASSCLIAASLGEGFGLSLVEAAQFKLPIIARDIPVFKEVAGEHAFYFTGTEAHDLAASIEQWLALQAQGHIPKSNDMPWINWQQSTQQLLNNIITEPKLCVY